MHSLQRSGWIILTSFCSSTPEDFIHNRYAFRVKRTKTVGHTKMFEIHQRLLHDLWTTGNFLIPSEYNKNNWRSKIAEIVKVRRNWRSLGFFIFIAYPSQSNVVSSQCDQKKITKCLLKFPKNDFIRKMIDFDTFTKMPKTVEDLGKLIVAKGFEKLCKVQ